VKRTRRKNGDEAGGVEGATMDYAKLTLAELRNGIVVSRWAVRFTPDRTSATGSVALRGSPLKPFQAQASSPQASR
jgi:hypothetical protein